MNGDLLSPYAVVVVVWVDACSVEPVVRRGERKQPPGLETVSIGFMYEEDKEFITIAQSCSVSDDPAYRDRLEIPKGVVKKIIRIKPRSKEK